MADLTVKCIKCTECGKDIAFGKSYYDYPTGAECIDCGRRGKMNVGLVLRFADKIARMEIGCAPSAGYMAELIMEARASLNINTKKQK